MTDPQPNDSRRLAETMQPTTPAAPRNAPLTLLSLLDTYDIKHLICSQLETKDLLALANTTKLLRQDLMSDRWDIDRKLTRFDVDPVRFRQLQADTGALVTGPFALNFVEGRRKGKNIAYIYVHERHAEVWRSYLGIVGDEDQKKVSVGEGSRPSVSKHDSTFVLVRSKNPLYYLLKNMHATFNCCLITWRQCFVLFPRETLDWCIGLKLGNYNEELAAEMQSFDWPPWAMDNGLPSDPKHGHLLVQAMRKIGDKHTMTISLDITKLRRPGRDFPIDLCEFRILDCDNKQNRKLSVKRLSNPLLWHGYTSWSGTSIQGTLLALEHTTLKELLPLALMKLDPKDRPADSFQQDLTHNPPTLTWSDLSRNPSFRTWDPPAGWEYVDENLVEWLKEMFRRR